MPKELLFLYRTMRSWFGDFYYSSTVRYVHKHFPDLTNLQDPFFIIALPGSLHLIELCLRYIPENIGVVLVSNGLEKWEQDWAKKHLRVNSIITIPKIINHGRVLDLLFEEYPRPFGILDYDCFVLNPEFFQKLQILDPGSLLNAIYIHNNPLLNLEFPETFILFFNTPIINKLINKYNVSCRSTNFIGLSREVRMQLATLGIDKDHYPEGYKNFFDTLRLLICLGKVDGYKCHFVEKYSANEEPTHEVFHVGGVSNITEYPKTKWITRGMYLWRRGLELNEDDDLKQRYLDKYGKLKACELMAFNPKFTEIIGAKFFSFVDELVSYKVHQD